MKSLIWIVLLTAAFSVSTTALAAPPTYQVDILQSQIAGRRPVTLSMTEIPQNSEGQFVRDLLAYQKSNPNEYPLIIFYTSNDLEIAQQLKDINPLLRSRLAGVQIDLPSNLDRSLHGSQPSNLRRTVASTFSVEQVKKAGQFVSIASIALSGISFYFSSRTGTVPTLMNLGLATTLTLLFTGQIPGGANFPEWFSKRINIWGKRLQPMLSTAIRFDSDSMKVMEYNIGRTLALAPPSLAITSLFFLAANSGNVMVFFSLDSWMKIFAMMGPGLLVNTSWDLFEADLRERNAYSDEDEKLARLSSYSRSLIGAAVGGLFYLPHYGVALNTSLVMTHAAIGFAAFWYAGKSVPLLEKMMNGLENSENFNDLVTGYGNFMSRLKGSPQKFNLSMKGLIPLQNATKVDECSARLSGGGRGD